MTNELQVRIYPSITKLIRNILPEHKRNQRLTPIVNDMLYWAIDNGFTLGKPSPSGAQGGAGFTSIYKEENKVKENSEISTAMDFFEAEAKEANERWIKEMKAKEKQKKKDQMPQAFLQFWRTYNSSPNKAGQSRHKALDEWKKAVKKVESSQKLIEAAQKAIHEQEIQMEVKGECLMLPDAFRWLRDERFVSLLEDNIASQQQQAARGPIIL